jgi:hypothetical protein
MLSVESDRSLSIAGSSDESPSCVQQGEQSIAVGIDRSLRSCSEVARTIAEALAAIEAGRVDLAIDRLASLLRPLGEQL